MVENKVYIKSISFFVCIALFLGLISGSVIAVESKSAVNPTESEMDIINEAVTFLDEMDMGDMAENVRLWLKNKKIKIDTELKKSGSTTPKGTILIKKSLVTPLPDDEYDKFERIIDLATVLYHEKIHAHQAPAGGAMAKDIEIGDWVASTDVKKECVGPDPLEVEAYYKQVRALFKWWQKIDSIPIPDSLTGDAKDEAESFKEYKKSFVFGKADIIMQLLKKINCEKANKFNDLDYLKDLYEGIIAADNITEEGAAQQMIDLLDSLIGKLFDPDGFYDKCRKLYEAKKGEKKTSMAIPAEPGSTEEYVLDLPDGNGYLSIAGLPIDLDVGESEMLNITITEFMIPPEADPGYAILSPVYEISWNSYSPVPFELTIYYEGTASSDMSINAFASVKTKEESAWTELETVIISEGDFNLFTISADLATMYTATAPDISFIDMPPTHWAYDSTARLEAAGILDELAVLYTAMEVPREMFVKYLVRALKIEIVNDSIPFTDVDETDPYFPYISTAYHNNLTSGVAIDRFGMGEIIPREQSITFLIRAIGMEEEALELGSEELAEHLDTFIDIYSGCSEWAHPYLAQAVKILMVEGYPDDTLRGQNLLNHAEVIALIDRIMIHLIYNVR